MFSAKSGFIFFAIVSAIVGIIGLINNSFSAFIICGIGFVVLLYCAKKEDTVSNTTNLISEEYKNNPNHENSCSNAVFEFYDYMEQECISIIEDFYTNTNIVGIVPSKNDVIKFFVLDNFNKMRKEFRKLNKEKQTEINNIYLQNYDSNITKAKNNSIPYLQDKILSVFQTNNFNNNPSIYWYNDLTPIAKTLQNLYEWVLKKGLTSNVIDKKEYQDLMQVLSDTIKENKWM